MSSLPKCPRCSSEFTYEDGALYICPECAHEWPRDAAESGARRAGEGRVTTELVAKARAALMDGLPA